MAMAALEPFVGTWDLEAIWPPEAGIPQMDAEVTTTFEWALDGHYLLQRSVAPPPIPQALCVIGPDERTGGYTQHYFDSRGVVRLYAMAFDGRRWTLERTTADFSPLDFGQRYVGVLADDGNAIEGRWSICHDGETWQTDFELHYRRRG